MLYISKFSDFIMLATTQSNTILIQNRALKECRSKCVWNIFFKKETPLIE